MFGYTNRCEEAVLVDDRKVRLGEIEVPVGHLGPGCSPADKGVLLMRTSAVQILDYNKDLYAVGDLSNQIKLGQAEIVDSRYLGGETELKLRLLQGSRNEIATIFPRMLTPIPKAGTKVKIWFDAEAICFFKEDQGVSVP